MKKFRGTPQPKSKLTIAAEWAQIIGLPFTVIATLLAYQALKSGNITIVINIMK